jgi:hypothetical protein
MLSEASATCLALTLKEGLQNQTKRAEILSNALKMVDSNHSSWENELDQIFTTMCSPFLENTDPIN